MVMTTIFNGRMDNTPLNQSKSEASSNFIQTPMMEASVVKATEAKVRDMTTILLQPKAKEKMV